MTHRTAPPKEPPEHPLMTLRVSRDGGRSWAPVQEIWPDDCHEAPWSLTSAWPPCQCPRHREQARGGGQR
jgi:hypothetical protein